MGNLERLRDVGAVDAIEVIQKDRLLSPDEKQKDIEFYHDQQTKRKATMAGKDKVLQLGIQNMNERVEREYTRSRSEQLRSASVEQLPSTLIDISCSSSSSQKCCSESAGEFECETDVSTSKSDYVILHAPKNLINNCEVVIICDRLKLSDNAATMILSTFIKACGGDINDFRLFCSSIYRSRIASRLQVSLQIISEFSQNPRKYVAVHWDGQLSQNRYGESHEALSIVATGPPNFTHGKFLAIQKLEQASGKTQAEAIFEVLDLWELIDNVPTLVFDTTASNSGWRCGAEKLSEGLMGKKLFYHSCHHHIYELVIKSVYQQIFGSATTGPENVLFKEFKSAWSNIDTTQDIKTLKLDPSYKWLEQTAKEVTEELTQLLSRE